MASSPMSLPPKKILCFTKTSGTYDYSALGFTNPHIIATPQDSETYPLIAQAQIDSTHQTYTLRVRFWTGSGWAATTGFAYVTLME